MLTRLVETSADTLHCTDNFDYGLAVRGKGYAFSNRSIQVNTPWELRYLVIDVDVEYPVHLPAQPSIAVLNEDNGHSHLFYELAKPVLLGDKAKPKPQRYLDSVKARLTAACSGDTCYAGHIAKNPIHPDWRVIRTGRAYTLDYLSDAVRGVSAAPVSRDAIAVSHSRNCTVFDTVRHWAYPRVNDYSSISLWSGAVMLQVEQVNQQLRTMGFAEQLPRSEVASVGNSVSKWTWANRDRLNRNYKRRGVLNMDPNLPLIERERLGAEYSARVKRAATEARLWEVVAQGQEQGEKLSVTFLARQAGVSRQVLYKVYDELLPELLKGGKVST